MADIKMHKNVYEALGIRLFTSPQAGFDPLKATDRELLIHGFPGRPDPKRYPEHHKRWVEAMSRPMTRVEPQFGLRTDRRHVPRAAGVDNATSTNWSGTVDFVAAGDSCTWVIGQWTVPHVVPRGNGDFYSSAWVGIDGDGSPDVLQAGTEQDVVGGVHQTYLWWEWFPEYEVQLTNPTVSPGDVIYCAICVHSPTEAGFYLTNLTTGVATSFTKTAPSGTTLVGNCAEWIVEAPTVNGNQSALPAYGLVYFDECVAGTKKGATLHGGQGTPISMVNANNAQISIPEIESDETIELRHAG
ncbi:MAG: G1 family glutamic endopeptidase [Candidatus Limnocylindrales bacterium]